MMPIEEMPMVGAPADVEETHSAADIVCQALYGLGYLSNPETQPTGVWPGFVDSEPDSPDKCVTIYDTAGRVFPRSTPDNYRVENPGIQIRVRAATYRTAFQKARQLATALDSINREVVDTGTYSYRINTIVRSSEPIRVGKESPTSKRSILTINAMVNFNQLPPYPEIISITANLARTSITFLFNESVNGLGSNLGNCLTAIPTRGFFWSPTPASGTSKSISISGGALPVGATIKFTKDDDLPVLSVATGLALQTTPDITV
jgi:hypothetical protein